MVRTIVGLQLGNIHFVFSRGRYTMDPVVDRPLLYAKWVLQMQLYNSSLHVVYYPLK